MASFARRRASNLLVIFLKEFQRLSDQGAISVSARYFETINNIITNTNIIGSALIQKIYNRKSSKMSVLFKTSFK